MRGRLQPAPPRRPNICERGACAAGVALPVGAAPLGLLLCVERGTYNKRQLRALINFRSPFHAFTWNLTSPFSKKLTIWFAAATPALLFASSVWAPIFFLVKMTRFMYLSPTTSLTASAFFGATSDR